jgi:hypothetical protein
VATDAAVGSGVAAPPANRVALPPPPAPAPTAPAPSAAARGRALSEVAGARQESAIGNLAAKASLSLAPTPVPLTLPEAVALLGGSLRLIEGLVPDRLEAVERVVRVVYRTGFGELVLAQELSENRLRYSLLPPRGFPADSLERLRARVRE